MYFITTKRMLELCFSAHPNIQYRTSYFCGFGGFFAKNLGLLTFANEIWPFAKKGGKSEVRFLPKELANIC